MDIYSIIGQSNQRKTSTIRSLTGTPNMKSVSWMKKKKIVKSAPNIYPNKQNSLGVFWELEFQSGKQSVFIMDRSVQENPALSIAEFVEILKWLKTNPTGTPTNAVICPLLIVKSSRKSKPSDYLAAAANLAISIQPPLIFQPQPNTPFISQQINALSPYNPQHVSWNQPSNAIANAGRNLWNIV